MEKEEKQTKDTLGEGYVSIQIPKAKDETLLEKVEEVLPKEEEEKEVKIKEEKEAIIDEEPQEQKKQEKEQPKKKRKYTKKPSKAEILLQQTKLEKERLAMELEELQKEHLKLNKTLNKTTESNTKAMKKALESTLDVLRAGMKEAIENGEAAESVKLSEEMISVKAQLDRLNQETEQIIPEVKIKDPEEKKEIPQKIPEKALEWVAEHPEFQTDELFYAAATTVSNQLIREGYSDITDAFYEELDARLSKRFPEVFGIDEKNDVNYKEQSKGSINIPEQTVSGPSRVTTSKVGSKGVSNKNTITLTPEDVKQAEKWGLSLEQIARRIAHREKNKTPDGYVKINLK